MLTFLTMLFISAIVGAVVIGLMFVVAAKAALWMVVLPLKIILLPILAVLVIVKVVVVLTVVTIVAAVLVPIALVLGILALPFVAIGAIF